MPARVLYLHGLESGPGNPKQRMIESVLGKDNVSAPNLKTRQTIVQFTIFAIIIQVIVIAVAIVCFVYAYWIAGSIALVLAVVLGMFAYFIGNKYLASRILEQAVNIAEKRASTFRPNIVAASSFGAMVAFQMKGPVIPLLLFAPAQDSYCRYVKISPLPSIRHRPYTLVVHGARDGTVPLTDSIRLVETAEMGKCRLEVVDDDHALKTLSADDMRLMVREVYMSGKTNTLKMSHEGDKNVDTTLYSDEEAQDSSDEKEKSDAEKDSD